MAPVETVSSTMTAPDMLAQCLSIKSHQSPDECRVDRSAAAPCAFQRREV